MSGVFAFLERWGGGAALVRVRLVDARDQRVWTPSAPDPGSPGDPETIRAAIREAAEWIARQLGDQATRGVLTVCLDADAARCAWLSSPSAEPRVVRAAVMNAVTAGGDDTGAATPTFWSTQQAGLGLDLSVQALGSADPAPVAKPARGEPPQPEARARLAVLAVPDLAARLLLDELDRLGIVVHSVTSLWHAAALAWDPSRAEELHGGTLANATPADPLLSAAEPVAAVVLVEPAGRLVWCWTRAGVLLAAGTMRLRRVAPAAQELALVSAVSNTEPPVPLPEPAPELEIDFSDADLGRILTDWLAWSLQLGLAPARIVGLGPTHLITSLKSPARNSVGIASVTAALATHWTGSVATAAAQNDPVRATLTRLAEAFRGSAEILPISQSLGELAARPSRKTRRMHWWLSSAIVAAVFVLAALTWRIERSGAALRAEAEQAAVDRRAALEKIKDLDPRLLTDPDPIRLVRTKLTQMADIKKQMKPERPVLPVFARLIEAVETSPGIRFHMQGRLSVSSTGAVTASFAVPDADAGARFLQSLRVDAAALGVDWRGNTTGAGDSRRYVLAGSWEDPRFSPAKPASSGPPTGAGRPSTAPSGTTPK